MAIATAYFLADLNAMIDDLPHTAAWGATEFQCSATPLEQDETLMLAGNLSVQLVRIIFPSDSFTVDSTFKPQARMQLKFPNPASFSNYEIVKINLSPDRVGYEVVMKADNRA
jgi:hypothetical protein